jgi:hypothetical protein
MRTTVKVFIGSGVFIAVSAAIYWFVSYEPAGTILLLGTAAATFVIAAYSGFEIRGAPEFVEDRGDADPGDGAGDAAVSFTIDSPWPLVFGIGAAVLAGGLVFGFPLLIIGGILIAAAVIGLMGESIA